MKMLVKHTVVESHLLFQGCLACFHVSCFGVRGRSFPANGRAVHSNVVLRVKGTFMEFPPQGSLGNKTWTATGYLTVYHLGQFSLMRTDYGRVIAMTEENNEVIRGLNISNHLQLVECQLWLVKSFFSFVETSGCSSKPCSDRQVSCMTSWGRQPTHRRKWCHFLEDFRNPRHAVATGWF